MEFWHAKAKALENELREKNLEIEAMRRKAEADDLESLKTQIWGTQLSSAKALENELREKNSETEAMRRKAGADDFELLKTQIWGTQLSSAKALENEFRERNLEIEATRTKADRLKLQKANRRECNLPRRKLTKVGLLFSIFERMWSALQDTESRYSELVKGEETHVKLMGSLFKFIRRAFGHIKSDGDQLGNKGPGRTTVDFMSFIFARIRKALRDGETYFLQLVEGHKPHIVNLIGSIFESIRVKLREIRIHYGLLLDQTSEKRLRLVDGDVQKDAPNDLTKQKRDRPDLFECLEQYLDNKYKRCRF